MKIQFRFTAKLSVRRRVFAWDSSEVECIVTAHDYRMILLNFCETGKYEQL
jgi:hypothetical protein